MLGIRLFRQINEHITAKSMRGQLGAKSILFYMRFLQLSWCGHVSRMNTDCLPRKFLTAWLPNSRRVGRTELNHVDTLLKGLASVGIPEEHWVRLASDEFWWSNFISIPNEEREAANEMLRQALNVQGPVNRGGWSYSDSFFPGFGTPLTNRKNEHMVTGGLLRERKVDRFANPTPAVDLRRVDSRNCFDPESKVIRYGSMSPESSSAQLVLEAGFDDRVQSTVGVRLSQNGVFYYRGEVERQFPNTWWSWMRASDEKSFGLPAYTSQSSGPSSAPPVNPVHFPTEIKFAPVNDRRGAARARLQMSSAAAAIPPPPSTPPPLHLSNDRPNQPPPTPDPNDFDGDYRRFCND